MKEVWQDIPGYEGLYKVSSLGRVRSLARFRRTKSGGICPVKEKFLPGTRSYHQGSYYLVVTLFKNGKGRQFGIHQLVLLAFVGPCPTGMEGCHFPDPNGFNNRLDNLMWATHAENNRHRFIHYGSYFKK